MNENEFNENRKKLLTVPTPKKDKRTKKIPKEFLTDEQELKYKISELLTPKYKDVLDEGKVLSDYIFTVNGRWSLDPSLPIEIANDINYHLSQLAKDQNSKE